MWPQYNLKYVPVDANKNHNLFVEEYYSSPDVQIYVDDRRCDFINAIQYTVQEQLNPIYGYASYVYDDIAIGNRIVVGSMRIPVANYSTFIRDFTKKGETGDTDGLDPEIKPPTEDNIKPDLPGSGNGNKPSIKPLWVQKQQATSLGLEHVDAILEQYESGNVITKQIVEEMQIVPRKDHTQDGNHGTGGGGTTTPSTDGSDIPKDEELNRKPYFKPKYGNFFKTYYATNTPKELLSRKVLRCDFQNIKIRIGNNIVKKLMYVTFRSLDHEISADGGVVYEVLQFIARDMEESYEFRDGADA